MQYPMHDVPGTPDLAALFRADYPLGPKLPQQQVQHDAHQQQLPGQHIGQDMSVKQSPLELFSLEGDDHTWDLADWNWDPYNMFAAPKEHAAQGPCCQALKRARVDNSTAQDKPVPVETGIASEHAVSSCNACPSQHFPGMHLNQPQAAQDLFQNGVSHNPTFNGMVHPASWNGSLSHAADPLAAYGAQHMNMMQQQHAAPVQIPGVQAPGLNTSAPSASFQQPGGCSFSHPPLHKPDDAPVVRYVTHKRPSSAVQKVDESDGEADGSEGGGAPSKLQAHPASTQAALEAAIAEGTVVLSDSLEDGDRMICQVAGCCNDLTHLKEYHQRYRICEVHIKLPQVIKDKRLQRFCQQCGRFHDLSAFDGSRKSCREQLSKHNARRRRRAQLEQQKAKAAQEQASAAALAGAMGVPDGTLAAAGAVAVAPSMSMGGEGMDVSRFLETLMRNPQHLHAFRLLLGVQTHPALPPMQPFSPDTHSEGGAAGNGAHTESAGVSSDPATYALARDMLQGRGEFAPSYTSDHRTLRISMKLFNRTPADLPPDIKQQVMSWLVSAPTCMEGCIQPGCVLLTMQLTLDLPTYEAAINAGLHSLMRHLLYTTDCQFWWSGFYAVQLERQVATVCSGQVTSLVDLKPGAQVPRQGPVPILSAVSSLCILSAGTGPGSQGQRQGQAPGPATLTLHGSGLGLPQLEVNVRYQGQGRRLVPRPSEDGRQACVTLPPLQGVGVANVEIVRGAFMSVCRPVLVVDDPAIAQEIRELEGVPNETETTAAAAAGSKCGDAGAEVAAGSSGRHRNLQPRLTTAGREALLIDLALVLRHAAKVGPPGMSREVVATKARRILAFACDMGWPNVAQRVLPVAMLGCPSARELVSALQRVASPHCGLSLLHRTVRSGSLAMLQGLMIWGRQHNYSWHGDMSGPGGITPLHLAALLGDAHIVLVLLNCCPPNAFTRLVAKDGVTPFHLAFQMGHYDVVSLMRALHCMSITKVKGSGPTSALALPYLPSTANLAADAPDAQPPAIEPCESCHSTVPPLLLSIIASCGDCGQRRPCLPESNGVDIDHECHEPCACPGTNGAHDSHGHGHSHVHGHAPHGHGHGHGHGHDQPGSPMNDFGAADWDWNNNMAGPAPVPLPAAPVHVHMSMAAAGYPPSVTSCTVHQQCDGSCSTCAHGHRHRYHITALCQGCHMDRVLQVA